MRRLCPGPGRRFGSDFMKVGMYPVPMHDARRGGLQDRVPHRHEMEGHYGPVLFAGG
ncbi:hypothetical protein ACVOMV_03080 [Mesorhizobium atlanticum]